MLDQYGFRRKNYAELQSEMEQRARELYGDSVNLSAKSFLGIAIRLFAWFLSKSHELAERVYNSGQTRKAEGVQLDALTPFYNTSRQPEQYATVALSLVGTPNATVLEGTRFETETGIDFSLTENITLDAAGNGTGQAVCLTSGFVGNVGANTIKVMSEPTADISSVNNLAAATGGRDRETDIELRARLLSTGAGAGSATANAIVAAIQNVTGVRAASIAVNNTSSTTNGMPPKSFQAFVLGGDGQAIAEAIFSKAAGGIESFGTAVYTVKDIGGGTHSVKYTPATEVNIFSTISVSTNSEFEANGLNQIKDAVVKLVGGVASDGTIYTGLTMGEDVYLSRVYAAVMSVNGVVDVSISLGKALEAQSAANIIIAPHEVAQTDTSKISVTVTV